MTKNSSSPVVVRRIAESFEFGQGSITAVLADAETLALMDEALRVPEILVPVEAADDGCSDGRPTVRVFRKQQTFKRSLHRAKVFGGAVTMTAAARIGLGLAGNEDLKTVFVSAIKCLQNKGIHFGAHTDQQATGENCGCGAIDKAPEALTAVLKYEEQICRVITLLGYDTDGVDEVFINFRRYVGDNLSRTEPYSGREIMKQIIEAGTVVKQLGGEHLECRILLNLTQDYTVNQKLIRWVTGNRAQAFAVDVWRLEQLAASLYGSRRHQALLSELVYTIATGAVLTKGDLPIDIIKQIEP